MFSSHVPFFNQDKGQKRKANQRLKQIQDRERKIVKKKEKIAEHDRTKKRNVAAKIDISLDEEEEEEVPEDDDEVSESDSALFRVYCAKIESKN